MAECRLCLEQAKKARRGDAHVHLEPCGEQRLFKGMTSRGYEEQDYQCTVCQTKFTRSTNRNDLFWTLWQG